MNITEKIKIFPNNLGTIDFVGNLSIDKIKNIDKEDMYTLLYNYSAHLTTAIINAIKETILPLGKYNLDEIITQINSVNKNHSIPNILILGIGGSAMSGELLTSYLKYTLDKVPTTTIVRGTEIPDEIDSNTLIFVCSYSGNTNETLSALNKIEQKETITKDNIISITSGGKLAVHSKEKGYKILLMPTGMMPRCAMWYSFFHLLFSTIKIGVFSEKKSAILIKTFENIFSHNFLKSLDYSNINNENLALCIAHNLHDKIILIYTAAERLAAINLRWKGQIQENANQLSFGNYFPELNHNEINGFMFPKSLLQKLSIIVMTDEDDGDEINNIISKSVSLTRSKEIDVLEVIVGGETLLERLIRYICLADWTSFYMAILNETDPTPIPIIMELKK